MAYSTLKRKAPLKRGVFKRSYGFKTAPTEQSSEHGGKTPSGAKERAKKARKSTKSSLETHLDIVFSVYIRLRDAMDGGRTRCISCGRVLPFEMMQCGHYFGRSNMATRWDEQNCSSECSVCNCSDANHLEGYTAHLKQKIGDKAYDDLCARARGARKWSGDELREMIRHYTAEARRLSKEKGIKVRI